MIRSVIVVSAKAGTTDEQLSALADAIGGLAFPGRSAFSAGRDLGLVPDTADLVMISDFADQDTYRAYVADEAHRTASATYLRPIAERVTRIQYEF